MAEKSNVLLKVKGLKVSYGGIQAVKGVDFEVCEGELVSLIGSNGAGKTTTMKAITGTQPMGDGSIEYLGESIKGKGAWDLVKKGLVMVPEGRGVFALYAVQIALKKNAGLLPKPGKKFGKAYLFGEYTWCLYEWGFRQLAHQ